MGLVARERHYSSLLLGRILKTTFLKLLQQVKITVKIYDTNNVTLDASVVSWARFTAEVGVIIAVHRRHRTAEIRSVAERTRSVSRCTRRLLGALGARAAALLTLVIH